MRLTGAAFLLHGAKRRGWDGLATVLLGGTFRYMGATGRNALYRNPGIRNPGIHLVSTTTARRQRCEVVRSMTIDRSIGELFASWRNLRNLPKIMSHLETVEVLSDKHPRWRAKALAGLSVECDAEIVNEKPDALIAWQSCEGSSISHWGVVRFNPAPGDRGTEIVVELEYEPLGSATGAVLGKLFGEEPSQQIEDDLRRFKQVMETGEVPTTKGQHEDGSRTLMSQ